MLASLFGQIRRIRSLLVAASVIFLTDATASDGNIQLVHAETNLSFRAATFVDEKTILVGGSRGSLLRSVDSGITWEKIVVADDSSDLDFRDVESVGGGRVVLMSAGPGESSRLFVSEDRGLTFRETHRNRIAKGFFNGISFWRNGHGLVVGDPINGRLFLLLTTDFGVTWKEIPGPSLKEGEYGFAASGTGIVTGESQTAVVATGGAVSRIFTSSDRGKSWTSKASSVKHGNASSGVFSVAVNSTGAAVAVGGDYQAPEQNVATYSYRIADESEWNVGTSRLPHKACVRFLGKDRALCVGRTGIAVSKDAGQTWSPMSDESFYTFALNPQRSVAVLAGADGRIALLQTTRL